MKLEFRNELENGCLYMVKLSNSKKPHDVIVRTVCLPYDTNGFDTFYCDGIDPETVSGAMGTAIEVWNCLDRWEKKDYDHMDIGWSYALMLSNGTVKHGFQWLWHGWEAELDTCAEALVAVEAYDRNGPDCFDE